MKQMARLLYLFLLYLISVSHPCFAQAKRGLPIGGWRQHTPYSNSFGICRIGTRIYSGSPSGLFFYDTEDGQIGTLNKVNGLYNVGLTCMQKHPERDLLLIGYDDGTLNFLEGNQIYTLKDITNAANIIGSKRINRIKFYKNEALVCTDFGIVIFNLAKREIRESNINLGDGGGVLKVLDAARFDNYYYALTDKGLKAVSTNEDFKNPLKWLSFGGPEGLPVDVNVFRGLDSLEKKLIIYTQAGFHIKSPDAFTFFISSSRIFPTATKLNLRFFNNEYYVAADKDIIVFDDDLKYKRVAKQPFVTKPTDCLVYGGKIWVADQILGIVEFTDSTPGQNYMPNAPLDPFCFSLGQYKDKIVSNFGGYTFGTGLNKNRNLNGFAIFDDNEWRTYNRNVDPAVPAVDDIVSAKFNPQDQTLYLASYGYGIMMKKDDQYSFHKDNNSGGALCNLIYPNCIYDKAFQADSFYIRIADLDFDLFGNLWAVNSLSNSFPPDSAVAWRELSTGRWRRIRLNTINTKTPLGIMVDRNNYKWVRMAPGVNNTNAGIVVINSDGSRQVALNSQSNQGNLPSSDVYAIKEDKQGYIWVGTQKGLCVYYNPFNAFYTGGISASTPIYPPAAGRPVLENDLITSIEIDGGNRKWVGTKDNGLWLFNPDITSVIHHFTPDNSPLLSSFIYSLAINKPTGELFIATDKGLISFQTDASENVDSDGRLIEDECSNRNISIFPNPVERGYDGQIAVRGLAANSTVKFISASGKLAYQTTAVGGMAVWNGITYEGTKAHPGIYIVLSSTQDGKANCVSKLAILD